MEDLTNLFEDAMQESLHIDNILTENFESLIARPKEFFKKIQLWRVSLFKEDSIKQYSFNPGTKLSKPRMSSFWVSGEKEWTYMYGFRIAINKLFEDTSKFQYDPNNVKSFIDALKKDCRTDLSKEGFYINAEKYPEEFVKKNLPKVYLYGVKIKGYETGIGWHNNFEYTVDKDIKPDSVDILDYNFFKNNLKLVYLSGEDYAKKLEEKRLKNEAKKKDPSYKHWDEKIGFPYADDTRNFGIERLSKFFETAIKSAMKEKNIDIRNNLMKDISEKYKIISGYRMRMVDMVDINVSEEYKNLFLTENDDLSNLFSESLNERVIKFEKENFGKN